MQKDDTGFTKKLKLKMNQMQPLSNTKTAFFGQRPIDQVKAEGK